MQYHVQRGGGWAGQLGGLTFCWYLTFYLIPENAKCLPKYRWVSCVDMKREKINKRIMDFFFCLFCFVKEENDIQIICRVLLMRSLFLMCFDAADSFLFCFNGFTFSVLQFWCLMIVVFCHIRLYILDLGISFPFFWVLFDIHEQMTAFWKKKKKTTSQNTQKCIKVYL